jgi:hypothetical protein
MSFIAVEVVNPKDVKKLLEGQPLLTKEVVDDTVADLTFEAERLAKVHARDKTRAPYLQTGRYFNSIHSIVDKRGFKVTGAIGSNVKYAPTLEEGSKPHIIRPKNKKGLFFPGLAHPLKLVRHPGTEAYNVLGGAVEKSLEKLEEFADRNFKRKFK